MDTKDIALFLTIARLGSISRTAEHMYMSQSTVTAHLQRLERALGYVLFHRLPNGVQLTPEGQQLLPLAERLTALEDQILHPETEQTPILRIMSGRAFVSTDVPECLHRMARKAKVHLKVRMGMYDEMMNALLANQVDFCFLGEPIYHPNVRLVEFTPDRIDLIVPKNHYFSHSYPGLHALNREPFVAFGRSTSPFRKRISEVLAGHNVYPPISMELDSIDGIKAMVGHGLGVSFLPRRTLHDAIYKSYETIAMTGEEWTRPTLIAYPVVQADRPLTATFLEVVSEYYGDISNPQRR
ncbi:LysR family transcriptional regulator [Alicyclobacillus ferrooxydans]|uniref:LysR family transcriptional regulator n=1 Tax=Alicyclobacillus ferrooxydans TaxID=471514 RepID=A0A0N8PP53_9BACL|nr:LysR family transcriptional regulator [Alicyclobacillus ferrooxydans]KPV43365.1 LysR family transcriptional regulator [Alicyclobacillus ferrooxydans]